ncbi:MAG: hypothetical protein ACXWD8_13870, partial [Mycobacterium sp.]
KADGRVHPREGRPDHPSGALAQDFLDRKKQSTAPSNYRMIESAWRVHVSPRWAERRVKDVTLVEVESWVAALCKSYDDDLDAVAVTLHARYSQTMWANCGQIRRRRTTLVTKSASHLRRLTRSCGGGGGI